jgi:hypothetical protein
MADDGYMTNEERDAVLFELQASKDVLDGVTIFLLTHLAKKENDPEIFLRQLSEELHGFANRLHIPSQHGLGARYVEQLRVTIDRLTASSLKRVRRSGQ